MLYPCLVSVVYKEVAYCSTIHGLPPELDELDELLEELDEELPPELEEEEDPPEQEGVEEKELTSAI